MFQQRYDAEGAVKATHALVGKDRGTVDEKLILDGHIVSENGNVLHPSPPSDR